MVAFHVKLICVCFLKCTYKFVWYIVFKDNQLNSDFPQIEFEPQRFLLKSIFFYAKFRLGNKKKIFD